MIRRPSVVSRVFHGYPFAALFFAALASSSALFLAASASSSAFFLASSSVLFFAYTCARIS
jgi:hypothetical protein